MTRFIKTSDWSKTDDIHVSKNLNAWITSINMGKKLKTMNVV